MKNIVIFSVLSVLLSCCFTKTKAQVNPSDSLELVSFYQSVCNTGCTLNWDFTQPVSTWSGIELSNNSVSKITIAEKGLSGNIPDLNLPNLIEIFLVKNQLSGPIPDFSNLPNLIFLFLSQNELSGTIPDFSNLTNLSSMYLDHNQLGGPIPDFSNLSTVNSISFSKNNLSGPIPDFSNLLALNTLNLSENNLSDTIPNFTNLPYLSQLYIDNNALTGSIPVFTNFNNLSSIDASNNQLSGCFDNALLSSLCDIGVQYNFEGNPGLPGGGDFRSFCDTGFGSCIPIPPGQSDSLELVKLYNATCNNGCTLNWDFTQPVSTWEGITLSNSFVSGIFIVERGLEGVIPNLNLPNLRDLSLGNNSLKGAIPDFSNLPELRYLFLEYNQLSGPIPDFSNLPNLLIIDFTENQLSGALPDFSNLPNLESLSIINNELSGSIPNFTNLSNLVDLFIGGNQLSGTIPNFNNLPRLTMFGFGDNQLTGPIPNFSYLSNLSELYVTGNKLSGSIPDFNNLRKLTYLDLGSNEFSDTIPNFSYLGRLVFLNLQNNDLSGSIPNFDNLPLLEYLHLNFNQLSGTIPDFDNMPRLLDLYVGHNQLSGTIPDLSYLEGISIKYNNFSHEDIRKNYAANSTVSYAYTHTPQYFGNEQFHTDTIGARVVLSPVPSIPYANPSVRWLQNEAFITPGYALNDTLYIIPALDATDIGVYQYHFIDYTLSPEVEFHSRPINNYVDGLDLQQEPTIQGELIIDYNINQSQAEIDSIRNELITKHGGVILDSCGCKVQLDLWKFGEDDIDIVREKIKINGTHERRTSSTEIDGNRNNFFIPDYNEAEYIITGEPIENTNDTTKVVVGVIDTGINTFHNSIYDNLWRNQAEQNGTPGIDDDQNGYIDDIFGYDFVSDSIMHDFHGHGTKVGGIITANTPQNMDIQVMPIRTFNEEGRGSLFDMLCGIYYAIENNSDIVNISAGYKGEKSTILQKALQYGRDKDVLFVVAAGNDTLDLNTEDYWPATFTRDTTLENTIITVTALDSTQMLADYANYGDTTVTIATSGQGLLAPAEYDLESFDYITGTSASAPVISLALATEKIKYPGKNPTALRGDFLNNTDISTDLINVVEGGRMFNVKIRQPSKLRVFLEGPLISSNGTYSDTMRTTLNQRGLLPGQEPIGPFAAPTPAGQPYKNTPWNYNGLEWSNTDYYLENRVDWVLVSLRTEIASNTEIYRTAAQVKQDGVVEFYRPIEDLTGIADSVYIVVEHRNHMGVMSPQKVPVYSGRFVYDFTKQDSYKDPTSVGQIEVKSGVWAMISGDSSQENDQPYYDINGYDKAIWGNENGLYDEYLRSDYDMNGDINGSDKKIWSEKIGLSNRVPK